MGAVNSYGEFCYNLEGTDVYNQMTTHDFDLKNADGETVSIGYCYEAFGIIVNKALLEKAGHSLDEITNFESLKAVADDIHARASELGFDAFTSAGLDGSSSWRFSGHLANMPLFYEFRDDNVTAQPATIKGTYLDNYKAIWICTPLTPPPPALPCCPLPATRLRPSSARARPCSIRTALGSSAIWSSTRPRASR